MYTPPEGNRDPSSWSCVGTFCTSSSSLLNRLLTAVFTSRFYKMMNEWANESLVTG